VILLQVHPCWERDVGLIGREQHPQKDQVRDEDGFRNRVLENGNLYAQRTRSDILRIFVC
jgi:hypothetical protein